MYAKLTYLFILSFVACLASSCTAVVADNVSVSKGPELSFAVSGLTRASVTTAFNEFAVYGDMKFTADNTAPTVIFNKTKVEYKNDSWRYDGTQYWFPKHEHSFVAVSPLSVLETDSNPRYSDSRLSFTYAIPTTDGGNEINTQDLADIIAATHRRLYNHETFSQVAPVRLKFFHIMSRINFRVKCDGAADKVTITKIEFERINKTGTFTITPAPLLSDSGQTDDYNISLTGLDKGTLTAGIDVDVANDNNTHPLFPDDNALFVVPQPDNKGIIMKITYKYDNRTGTEEQTLTAQEAIGGWEPGKLYLYSLTLDTISKEIYMTVSVKEWEPGSDNDVNVPRK